MPAAQNAPLIGGWGGLIGSYKSLPISPEGVDYEMRVSWSRYSILFLSLVSPSAPIPASEKVTIGLYESPGAINPIIDAVKVDGLTAMNLYQDFVPVEKKVLTSPSLFIRIISKHSIGTTIDAYVFGRYLP